VSSLSILASSCAGTQPGSGEAGNGRHFYEICVCALEDWTGCTPTPITFLSRLAEQCVSGVIALLCSRRDARTPQVPGDRPVTTRDSQGPTT
jgi:hypothetical protein